MFWRWAADGVALFHGMWIAAVLFGPLWAWRRPTLRSWHLALLWLAILGWRFYCPLTLFEDALRANYDPANPFTGQFFARYIQRCLPFHVSWKGLAWAMQIWGLSWTGIYAAFWARERRERRAGGG